MMTWLQTVVTIFCAVIGSSAFWAYLQKRTDSKDAKTRMLIGLGHDRIIALGLFYIERGYITEDEYENLHTYLYEPYAALGGNGSAKRVMAEVDRLQILKTHPNKGGVVYGLQNE